MAGSTRASIRPGRPQPFSANEASSVVVVALAIGGVHQEVQRRLEDLLDFGWVRHRFPIRVDQAQHRLDAKPGRGQVGIEPAQHLHPVAGQTDFLLRLTQGRRLG